MGGDFAGCEKLVEEALGAVAGDGLYICFCEIWWNGVGVVAEEVAEVEGVGYGFVHCD